MLPDRVIEHLLCLRNLHPDFGQKGHFEWSSILINKRLYIHPVKLQGIVVVGIEAFLWKMKGLLYEVGVCIIHLYR